MEKWKIWLIVSGVCSLIVGVGSLVMFLNALIYCEPEWINPLGETMGGYCSIVPSVLDLWWMVPLSFLLGFFVPVFAVILGVIGGILDYL